MEGAECIEDISARILMSPEAQRLEEPRRRQILARKIRVGRQRQMLLGIRRQERIVLETYLIDF